MAKKRMFSLQIVDTDAFLDMPLSSQALYFHLSMRADDDGFVDSYKKIMKFIGCQQDDLKVLLSKRFIIDFETGVIVIKHWRINNYIRNDRYQKTAYLEEKKLLTIKENDSYTELGIPNDDQKTTSGVHSIDKIRLDKVSIDKLADKSAGKQINELLKEFETINPIINYGNKTQRKAMEEMLKKFGYDKLLNTIKFAISIQGKKYTPTITTPIQLKNKLGELLVYYKKKTNNPMIVNI